MDSLSFSKGKMKCDNSFLTVPEGKTFWKKKTTSLRDICSSQQDLNIIITSWQRKAPICHWKICPYMKQMIAEEAWSQTRPAVWLP